MGKWFKRYCSKCKTGEKSAISVSWFLLFFVSELQAKQIKLIIPNEKSDWTLIFNTVAQQWGAYKYDETKDALRIDVKHEEVDNVENLVYKISDDGMVSMEWATSRVGFKIN